MSSADSLDGLKNLTVANCMDNPPALEVPTWRFSPDPRMILWHLRCPLRPGLATLGGEP
ncbi:hypothetical protein LNQ03_08315 [Klebsiella pneumoniae subsp. pneumoniae]|nr:hypothetical protein [Klebsiella pneumoniae subsp. pneumoniae]